MITKKPYFFRPASVVLRVLLIGCFFAGCCLATVSAEEDSLRVVFFGDSITAGYGLEEEESYPYLLQQKADENGLQTHMINAGLSGDTTSGGLRRVDWTLRQPADIFLLALGGNDGLRGLPVSTMESNLRAIIDKVQNQNPETVIILAGMAMPESMGADYAKEFQTAFTRIAKDKDVHFLPFLLEGVGGKAEYNLPDRIHPNAEGQAIIAAQVWEILESILRDHSSQSSTE